MFDDTYLKMLKIARWRDLQLAQLPGAENRAVRDLAIRDLIRHQTLISAIEAVRDEEPPSADDLQGVDFEGNPLDPSHPCYRPAAGKGQG
jgi:hypothetical protein